MIPLRDRNPLARRPLVTYLLIAANVAAFLYEKSFDDAGLLTEFVYKFGVVPRELLYGGYKEAWITPLTSMFLHGSWLHLIGNMWFLHVFGDNVEDRLGRVRYVLFYVLCGLAAVAAQVAIGPHSSVPMIGASGAIAGALGGYVRLFPRARVVTLVPIFIFFHFTELPAAVFIVIWFVFQLLLGVMSVGAVDVEAGGIAFFAHVGGFIAGLVLVERMLPRINPSRGWRRPT